MTKITTVPELRASIRLLEIRQAEESRLFKEELRTTYENLKPASLIKKTLHDLTQAPDLKGDLMNATISLAAGFLSKKAVVGDSSNPLKQLAGTLLQMGVTSIVSKNSDLIRTTVMSFINKFLEKKGKESEE